MAVMLLFDGQRAACRTWLDDLAARNAATALDRPYDRLVLLFRSSQIEAIVRWLDICAGMLGVAAPNKGDAAL
jgi:hypothetical protein